MMIVGGLCVVVERRCSARLTVAAAHLRHIDAGAVTYNLQPLPPLRRRLVRVVLPRNVQLALVCVLVKHGPEYGVPLLRADGGWRGVVLF